MKKNYIVLIVLGIALLILAGVYFFGQNKLVVDRAENAVNETADGGQMNVGQLQNKLVTDDFEMNIPSGWIQTAPAAGTSAMAVNTKESLNDPAAQKINFQSYFAVSYDVLQGKSLSEYSEIVKNGLRQTIQGVIFANEHDIAINGRSARAFEADLSQQGANFRILMVSIKGDGDDVWTLSFNTTKSAWDGYTQTFSDVVNSFNLKK